LWQISNYNPGVLPDPKWLLHHHRQTLEQVEKLKQPDKKSLSSVLCLLSFFPERWLKNKDKPLACPSRKWGKLVVGIC
jgi:hypothetical protein